MAISPKAFEKDYPNDQPHFYVDYPTEHPGVVRAENAAAAIRTLRTISTVRAVLLRCFWLRWFQLAMVVANQVIDTWAKATCWPAWMVLWVVAFAALPC